jgi:sialate O-acetylesterase
VRLPKLISDGMVLQREQPLKLWGWASPRERITVSFLGADYRTAADRSGRWQLTLPAQPAGGPYTMTVKASNTLAIDDILIGDVWLCSGQSNMETPMSRVMDLYAAEIKQIHNPSIRHYKTPHHYAYERPDDDLPGGAWKAATQENILDFSAAAYFFAEALYARYKIPIGLFNSSVGGSPAEAWVSVETLRELPEGYMDALAKIIERNRAPADDSFLRRWLDSLPKDAGASQWHKAGWDDSGWDEISLPGYWGDKDVDFGAGVLWLRKEIDLPASMAGKEGVLRLGCIVNSDSAFVNGVYVGNTTYQYPPRIYRVPPALLRAGKNVIAVRVASSGPRGCFVEEKPYKLLVGDEAVDITGQWKYKVGVDYFKSRPAPSAAPEATPPPPPDIIRYTPAGLYNGMIAPALNYAIKGVLWYQGESNTGRTNEYESLFAGLIRDWRAKWNHPALPFLYVQLPNFSKAQRTPGESGWADIRDIQRRALAIPHTGMAVAIDLGEWNDIHPLNKKDVGRRLALEAQRVAYGETLISQGPLYESMEVNGGSLIVTFTSVGSGIYTNLDLHEFAVAGEDGRYVWAEAVVIAKDKVKVWHPSVPNPVSVRYAWADNPHEANLRNKEGLPAAPFQGKIKN